VNLTVLGAAGRTGRSLVVQALERGHSVTAFVRSPSGEPGHADAVRRALEGADAVVSAMGPMGPDPGSEYSDAIGTVVELMTEAGPRRLVISANSRVLDDRELWGQYAAVSAEHRAALAALRAGDLDWTVVCTPMLSDDEPRGAYASAVGERSEGSSITRPDFATAMLDALEHPEWVGRIVDVSNPD
jgi:putative NADH-flavin reductase